LLAQEAMAIEGKDVGVGFGGVWTCTDEFVHQRRKCSWAQQAKGRFAAAMPPRLFVDYTTLISEVPALHELRRGDHGLIAINVVRCLSPALDRLVSFAGSVELTYVYHHFTMMDDVCYVDDFGVPRTHTGNPAEILEYSNTIPEIWEEVRQGVSGAWYQLPLVMARCMFDKAHCHRVALADYGDSPNLYVVCEHLDEARRQRVYANALRLEANAEKYNMWTNNCEHTANLIHKEQFTSPNVHFLLGACFRTLLCFLSFFFLDLIAVSCDSGICLPVPAWVTAAFLALAALPMGVQAATRFVKAVKSFNRHRAESLINHNDYWHLLAKELARMVVSGGGAVTLASAMPKVVLYTRYRYFTLACMVCTFAYVVIDMLFNLLAHSTMRLVFLPLFGKVWLIEGSDTPNLKKKVM